MDTSCPHCGAAYRVPDNLLTPGQALRCAACGGDWTPIPVPDGAVPAEVVAPVEPIPDVQPDEAPAHVAPLPAPPAATPNPPRLIPRVEPGRRDAVARRAALPLAWLASLAMLGLGLAALVVYRVPLAEAWPPFARLGTLVSAWLGG